MSADITSNLLAKWACEEGTGTSVADSSGNARTGTLSSAGWGAGRDFGSYALNLTGANLLDSANFADNLSAFTVSAWFRTSVEQSGVGGMLVSKLGAGGAQTGTGWMLLLQGPTFTTKTVAAVIQQGGGTIYRGRVSVPTYVDGAWHHAAMVVTSLSALPDLYIDGTAPSTTTLSAGTMSSITNANNVRVGGDYDSEYFNGQIDDVRIFSRSLTAEDIAALFQDNGGGRVPGNISKRARVGAGMSRSETLS